MPHGLRRTISRPETAYRLLQPLSRKLASLILFAELTYRLIRLLLRRLSYQDNFWESPDDKGRCVYYVFFFVCVRVLRKIELSLLLLREPPDFKRKLRHGTFYLFSRALFCERK